MTEPLSSASEKAGLPPGSLVHVGEARADRSRMSVVDFCKESFEERAIDNIEETLAYRDKESVTWVNIEGLTNIALIENIGTLFNIHPLVLEDVLNTHQRPKIEEYDDFLYFVAKCPSLAEDRFSVSFEQVSIILLDNFVFTFKEKSDDLLVPIKTRLKNSKGHFRSAGADYLVYVILDTIVDEYFAIQDSLDDLTESIEDELLSQPTTDALSTIQRIKRELIQIRKMVSPLRELFNVMLRTESPLIQDKTRMYFRDVNDHVMRVSESLESHRDLVSDLLDIYISSVNNKMNEIMKVLTVFASIFIPLTFLAGVYGMNFAYMPELHWRWAYPVLWIVFIMITLIFLVYFKRKKWV